MSTDFTDIEKNLPNGQNMGGIPQVVYYALHKDVASWPVRPKPTGSTLEQMGELSGNVVMKAGKAFRKFYVTDDEGKLDFEGVGEKDGKSFVLKLRMYSPGLTGKVMGLLNLIKNESLVFIVPDNNGNHFLLGDELRPAALDSIEAMTTGQKTEERPGVGMIFAYKTANVYRYKGNIPIIIPPTMIRACCPDGKDDYLSFPVNILHFALFEPHEGKIIKYKIDMMGEGGVFGFNLGTSFHLGLYFGNGYRITLFTKGHAYALVGNIDSKYLGKRLKICIELGTTPDGPTISFFINDIKINDQLINIDNDLPAPTATDMKILNYMSSPFEGNLFSFSIERDNGNTAIWNFTGTSDSERLKNKTNTNTFDLTAHNVDNMNQFIKDIPIPE